MIKPFRIYVILLVLFFLSILSIPKLNISPYPKEDTSDFTVVFSCPRFSPDQTEQTVTAMLENLFSQLKNLKSIKSTSKYNYGKIDLTFDLNDDLPSKKIEIASLLRQIRSKLPPGVSYPSILSNSQSVKQQSPSLVYAITSSLPSDIVEKLITEKVFSKLGVIGGVADLKISGLPVEEIIVRYDDKRLLNIGSSKENIVESIKKISDEEFDGRTKLDGLNNIVVRSASYKSTLESISETYLANAGNYKLGDVATVSIEKTKPIPYRRNNGNDLILLNVYFESNVNSIEIANNVKVEMAKLRLLLPSSINYVLNVDESFKIKNELSLNSKSIILGLVTLFTITFFYFGLRMEKYKIYVLKFSLSLLFTVLIVKAFSINLNLYSIHASFTIIPLISLYTILATDKLIDNRTASVGKLFSFSLIISISSYIYYYFETENKGFLFEIFKLATLTSIASFIVNSILYKHNISQSRNKTFKFPDIKPYRYVKWYSNFIFLISSRKILLSGAILTLFGLPLYLLPKQDISANDHDSQFISKVYNDKIAPILEPLLGGVSRIFVSSYVRIPGDFSTESETKLYVKAEMPLGTNIEDMNLVLLDFEKTISKLRGINLYYSQVNSGQSGFIEVSFDELYLNSNLPINIKNLITSKALDYGGAKWSIYGVGRGFSNILYQDNSAFSLNLVGSNYSGLEQAAKLLEKRLASNKRVMNINIDSSIDFSGSGENMYQIEFDDEKMMLNNVNKPDIVNLLRNMSYQDHYVGSIAINNKETPIKVMNADSKVASFWALNNETFFINSTKAFKVGSIANIGTFQTSGSIRKIDRSYVRVISFDYAGDYQFGIQFLKAIANEFNDADLFGTSASIKGYSDVRSAFENYKDIAIILAVIISCCMISIICNESLSGIPSLLLSLCFIYSIMFYAYYKFSDIAFDQGGPFSFIFMTVTCTVFHILLQDLLVECNRYSVDEIGKQNIFHVTHKVAKLVALMMINIAGFKIIGSCLGNFTGFFWDSFYLGIGSGFVGVFICVLVVIPSLFIKKKTNSIKIICS